MGEVEPKRALAVVNAALRDIRNVRGTKPNFDSHTFRQRYVATLSSHFGSWGIDPPLSAKLAENVFKLHRNIVRKVDPFLRENYGFGIFRYDYDVDLLHNALLRIYGDHVGGILEDVSRDPGKAHAYISILDATAQAVQRNFALTDHIIREGYSLAPYAPYIRDHPRLYELVNRALRRRYPRLVTDLRHMMDVFFASDNLAKYLDAADMAVENLLRVRGKSSIPRQHITPYVVQVLPFALHASLIDSEPPKGSHATLFEISKFLFGPNGKYYLPNLRHLAQNHELYPLLIGIAKHWDRNLNPRLWDAFQRAMRHGPHTVREMVDVDGRVAWGHLWPHLSQTAIHDVSETDKDKTFISIGKNNPIDQLRALCEQPTCLYPANEQGQRYGVEYALNTKKGDVMPVIAVAHRVSKARGGKDRVVGRLTMFAHPSAGNIYLVSTPVGSVNLRHYVDAALRYAREVNRSAGEDVFKRVVVGGIGNLKFRIPVDDAYGDMIVRREGIHYVRDAKVVPVK